MALTAQVIALNQPTYPAMYGLGPICTWCVGWVKYREAGTLRPSEDVSCRAKCIIYKIYEGAGQLFY